ncbi:alpha/beta fold hydrolase [Pseudobacter ginsenosidimutans]|uniref:Pimeloyl-ACP methyl ester carboxylesterase n=1 Tax=Pseudobacter ginsenosidimutans TaxID=661488 RepID=A0A4Q7MUM5_9BACT|nr:alpha/beta hydrolase [Pseudobacter ginsenosidimutans]RZS71674.1 pimeloyl-ACP methyl ester carboxylesterase [Pseudobacter ginsenosidimutans]
MKHFLITVLLAAAILQSSTGLAQTKIPYGSNNGSYKTINGAKLYYEEYGKGTPLLLIHGGLSSIEGVGPLIPELSKKFRVIAVDCPGQGRSEQGDSVSYQLMADYLLKLVDALKLDSTYIFGYSDGGNVALLMAADRPDKVKKAVAFAAASDTSGYFGYVTSSLDELTPEVMEKDYRWWLDVHLKKTPQKDKWKKFAKDFRTMCSTPVIVPAEKLAKIQSRVLIVQGDNDIVKLEHAVQLHQSIKGSQLGIIPAASHFIIFEKPGALNSMAIEFFTKEPKLFDWTKLNEL